MLALRLPVGDTYRALSDVDEPHESPSPEDARSMRSSLAGVGRARPDAVLPDTHFTAATLRWTDAHLALELCLDDDLRSTVIVARDELLAGWFVPAFTERALGLALAGEERPVVTTANFAPWLVIATRDGRWLAFSTPDRDRAYDLLEAFALGPSTRSVAWELFGLSPNAESPPASRAVWPPTRATFERTSAGAIASTVIVDAVIAYAGAWLALVVVTSTAVAAVAWSRSALRKRISSLSVDHESGRALLMSPTLAPLDLELRKIEGARFTRSGVVLEYEDAPRPIVVDVLDRDEAARAVEGQDTALSKLRVAHTFADWALRARDQRR